MNYCFSIFALVVMVFYPLAARAEENSISDKKPPIGESDKKQRADSGGKVLSEAEMIERLPPHLRQKVMAMGATERETFLKNMTRWQKLGSEDRKRLKEAGRDDLRRMWKEMNRLADELGLPKESEERKQFAIRFREERRKVDAEVAKQIEAIRRPMLEAMWKSLQAEFKNKESLTTPQASRQE